MGSLGYAQAELSADPTARRSADIATRSSNLGGNPFGNVWYVDSGAAKASDSTTHGYNPLTPWATIDYAIGRCTASQGDTILVAPGHAETISGAGGITCDVIGITIRGMGTGTLRPTITIGTATTADILVSAANVTIENMIFTANYADIANAIDVDATDFTLRGCHFGEGTNLNFLTCLTGVGATAATSRLIVENCTCICPDAANTHFIEFVDGIGTGNIVRNNILFGDWGSGAIEGSGAMTFLTVANNLIYNEASDNDTCINLAAATGIVAGNLCGGAAAQANGVTAPTCIAAENYYGVLAEDLSAILDPIAT